MQTEVNISEFQGTRINDICQGIKYLKTLTQIIYSVLTGQISLQCRGPHIVMGG